ncbi:MAG TPA: hypothetical protein VM076_12130 [Gemmatimonadaceae bacterium]|nr:hypothetical protein [Gemmatimonadaceae bacterium]
MIITAPDLTESAYFIASASFADEKPALSGAAYWSQPSDGEGRSEGAGVAAAQASVTAMAAAPATRRGTRATGM